MPEKNTFYITSPIFYPNGELHIGHAYTMIVCDIFARFNKQIGNESYFLTGADENSVKIVKAAAKNAIGVHDFLNEVSSKFKQLFRDINVQYDQFIRTTDKDRHWPGAHLMWKKLEQSGDIYKGAYEGLYCPSCEAFYTEKDLVDGKCRYHGIEPTRIKEENYFFRLSKYTNQIKEKIESGELTILPQSRKNEIVALLDRGLEDVSFSRPIKNVPHGIPVPGDETQAIYVWCDALVNYISALGYGREDDSLFQKFWPANVHVIGKDILRFHAAIWPGMLLSAGIPLPKNILVHGLIMSEGKKMSKSVGNVIPPYELLNEYGSDAIRYFFARHISLFEDGEMTKALFKDAYNSQLANGIGNLTNRVLKMALTYNVQFDVTAWDNTARDEYTSWKEAFSLFDINKAADIIWKKIGEMDAKIQSTEPFKLVKTEPEKAKAIVYELLQDLSLVAELSRPIFPQTSSIIATCLAEKKMPEQPLFLRKD